MKKINIYIIVSGLFLITTIVSAQNYNDALRLTNDGLISSARALGMGNAFISVANDLSAAQFNPAGIALVKKGELEMGLNYNAYGNQTTFMNNLTTQNFNETKWNQVGFVAPVPTSQGSFAIAMGYNLYKDFNKGLGFNGFNSGNTSMIQDFTFSGNQSDEQFMYDLALSYHLKDKNGKQLFDQNGVPWDTTLIHGNLNQSGNVNHSGRINTWFLSSGIEIEKNIFLGGTLNIYSGSYERFSTYTEADSKNVYPNSLQLDPDEPQSAGFQSFTKNDRLNWDISGWDFKLGLLAKLDDKFSAGVTVQFPSVFTIKETFNVWGINNVYYFEPWQASMDESKIQYDVTTPFEYAVGVSYHNRNYTLSANAKFVDYSTLEFSSGFTNSTISQKNQEIKDAFGSVLDFNVGAEYEIPSSGLALRAGFMYMPSQFKNDPSEYNKKYITGGLGYNFSNLVQLNVGVAYGWWKDFGDNYGSGDSRTFQNISVTNVIATVKYFL